MPIGSVPPMPPSRRAARGFSILEVVIALTLLAAAITPIYFVFNFSTRANIKSTLALQAANLAVEKMEYYKYCGLTPLALGVPLLLNPVNEYDRLKLVLESARAGGANYVPYEHKEDYGAIYGFPEFKRETRVAFFPEETITPVPRESPFNNTSAASPAAVLAWHEALRLQNRIAISVTVTYKDRLAQKEGGGTVERTFTAFTLVTNKEM